jgi:hypothetical protein
MLVHQMNKPRSVPNIIIKSTSSNKVFTLSLI